MIALYKNEYIILACDCMEKKKTVEKRNMVQE